MAAPAVLLVIGIHREELPFGEIVAADLDRGEIEVLAIPEGLPGRRPRPDQHFRYATLHRELYLQLLPHVTGRHRLMIDLHTGVDPEGPCADVYCRDEGMRACLTSALARRGGPPVRLVGLGPAQGSPTAVDPNAERLPYAATVIPERVWNNEAFGYVGLEIYLAQPGRGQPDEWAFARDLIGLVAQCSHQLMSSPSSVTS